MKIQGENHTNNAIPVFCLRFGNTLNAGSYSENSFAGDFHAIRWRQLLSVSQIVSRLCAFVLKVDINEVINIEIMEFEFEKKHAKAGMIIATKHIIDNDMQNILVTSTSILFSLLTSRQDNSRQGDMYNDKVDDESTQHKLSELKHEFLIKHSNRKIPNPIQCYVSESQTPQFILAGKFSQIDNPVNSGPVPVSFGGVIDAICKSKRFFILQKIGEKSIRVQFDFLSQFKDICEVFLAGERYVFHLLFEQDALGRKAYYTLESIGERACSNLGFNF